MAAAAARILARESIISLIKQPNLMRGRFGLLSSSATTNPLEKLGLGFSSSFSSAAAGTRGFSLPKFLHYKITMPPYRVDKDRFTFMKAREERNARWRKRERQDRELEAAFKISIHDVKRAILPGLFLGSVGVIVIQLILTWVYWLRTGHLPKTSSGKDPENAVVE